MDKPRVVLDTNVYISAIFWRGLPYRVVSKAADNGFAVFVSQDIINELMNVLARDFGRSKEEISAITDSLELFAKFVESKVMVNEIKEDSSDDRILECALASNSHYIVTQDNHLLKLKAYKDVKIVTPKEFLDLVK
ncbi:MAG: putative toxin-antitoxin system toxin component, PIN family [Nanoarchaeota archaeon]|nr:putative toxin-antitoxin system toxin component, PIN family [Nanoarchaeota archaeon]